MFRKFKAGLSHSTEYPDFDFETYSPAGFVWDEAIQKFKSPHGAKGKGLPVTGVAVYSEHPDCEVLCMAYDLKDGKGPQLWVPKLDMNTGSYPLPTDLLTYVSSGGVLEAWNSMFEHWIWNNVCVTEYGFPLLPLHQLRCAKAKAQAFSLPPSLEKAGDVLNIYAKKDKDGKRLLNLFSIPRNPTKYDGRKRILPSEEPQDERLLHAYNIRDIEAEAEISRICPDLSPTELEFWYYSQVINHRGVQIDLQAIHNCVTIVEAAFKKYNAELVTLTNGAVNAASEIQRFKEWMATEGISTASLTKDDTEELLDKPFALSPKVFRALKIRQLLGLASVKKLFAMLNQVSSKGRLHDLFIYHSARTGRAAGAGPQPQNLPNSGPNVNRCDFCSHYHTRVQCPWCVTPEGAKKHEWNHIAVEDALETISTQSLSWVEYHWGDALQAVSGCLRGLFISAPGHDLICSDYSAIEAVVLAMLAGETWREEVFRTHGKIYEASASKVSGTPFDSILAHKETTGQHHPLRKLGKVAELASGYQGWIGGWKAFGAEDFLSEDEIEKAILAWRAASPKIVEFWGGQERNWRPEFYGLEGAAIQAVLSPGTKFTYRAISYIVHDNILYCELPSGRHIVYHRPQLIGSQRRAGTLSLSYEGWNTNQKYGVSGWMRIETWGGRLVENVVQAVARDILAYAIVNLEKSGYPVVLHVHDEIVSEVPEGHGSVEEFERIMSTLPDWCKGWPIVAKGGWRGKRYRK